MAKMGTKFCGFPEKWRKNEKTCEKILENYEIMTNVLDSFYHSEYIV